MALYIREQEKGDWHDLRTWTPQHNIFHKKGGGKGFKNKMFTLKFPKCSITYETKFIDISVRYKQGFANACFRIYIRKNTDPNGKWLKKTQ